MTLIGGCFRADSNAPAATVVVVDRALAMSQQQPAEANTLQPDVRVDREIAGGQKQIHQVSLSERQFANVIVEQRGIDVIVRVIGVDGKLIAEVDSEIRLQGRETMALVSEAAGNYTVEIEAKYKTFPAGRYQVVLTGLRDATDQDRSLLEARRLYNEAFRLVPAGKYDQARAVLERSLEIRLAAGGSESPDTARSLMLMGNIWYFTSDYPKAETFFTRAVALFEQTVGADSPLLATCINNLASLYQVMGDLVKSEAFHKRALGIREKALPPGHPDIAQSLNNLANVYRIKDDYVNAEPLYVRALEINEKILGPDHINLASPLSNLAQLYVELDDYEKAERLFLRSLEIRRAKLGPEHPEVAGVLSRLGMMFSDQGKYAAAEPLLQQARAIWEKTLGPNHSQVGSVLNNLGIVYYSQKAYERAESLYQRSLAIKESTLGPDHPDTILTLNNLAKVYIGNRDYSRALDIQSRAISATEHNIALNLASGSERQKLAYLGSLPEQFNQTISLHVAYDPNSTAARDLAVSTLLQRKGRVLDVMSDSLAALRRRVGMQDQGLLDSLNEVTSSLATLVLNGPQKMSPDSHREQIKALEKQRESLEGEVSRRSAGFFEQRHPHILTEIQAEIPSEAALLEFAVYRPYSAAEGHRESHYVVYVIRGSGDVTWKDLGEVKPIDDAIAALRRSLRDPRRKEVQAVSRVADEKIMRPVRSLIGTAEQLLISADGPLNLVPFEALVDERNRYLVERYSISYLTSGRDLLRLKTARPSKSGPVAVAAPQFERHDAARAEQRQRVAAAGAGDNRRQSVTSGEDLSSVYFASLVGTSDEARAIKLLFPETRLLIGESATESALKRLDAPVILHIATHGFFLRDADESRPGSKRGAAVAGTRAINARVKVENPLLRSGLALAGANSSTGSADDGILTALEASNLNLWGTRLVTLSACDTGVGEVRNGEGIYGLRRAFVLAGTETLVMSLWPVSDYVTRELMTAYYRGLKQHQGRGEALRQVKLSMLRRKDRQHPFYWASFIQSGEWANLDGKR
jgi:CHAT domain-containing protein/Tfp pilus assembly protein PilF